MVEGVTAVLLSVVLLPVVLMSVVLLSVVILPVMRSAAPHCSEDAMLTAFGAAGEQYHALK